MAEKTTRHDNILAYPAEEFIPYAAYLDKNTIITKNSDLLVVFKISSFISNPATGELFDLRENLRNALKEIFKNENFSFYFTTVRKQDDIIPFGEYDNSFSQTIAETWNKQNNWFDQFVNEVYITVIISPTIENSIFNPLFFLTSLTQIGVNSYYSKKIQESHNILKKASNLFLKRMEDYGMRMLTMVEKEDGAIYSEHMRFFSLYVNLTKENFPVTYDNIADVIRQNKIAYGSDIIESDFEGQKRFASVFTVKTFNDINLTQLDRVLQLPMEFVITESASFIDGKYAIATLEDQKKMISLSEDLDFAYITGLEDMYENNKGTPTDFCINQTTIMVVSNKKANLIKDVKLLYKALDDIGLVAVKENTYMPSIFWSQLPGNFNLLKRFYLSPCAKTAEYVSLFNFPTGKLRDNYWGNAITILPSALNTPYYFNFHNGMNGNTIIAGYEGTGKTTIMNFLISEATKVSPKILYLDCTRNSEVFINAIGGKYYKIGPSADGKLNLNPFVLNNSKENKEFLRKFIITLVDFQDDGFVEMGKNETQLKSEYNLIPKIIEEIFAIPESKRSFSAVAELFNNNSTSSIYKNLALWYGKGPYAFIFDNIQGIDFDEKIIGISLRTIVEEKNLFIPFLNYIFHRINQLATGEPFIFAIDDAFEIVDNEELSQPFLDLIGTLPPKNVATIITTSANYELEKYGINKPIVEYFGTEIYLTFPKLTRFQKEVFSLQEEESKILSLMQLTDRNFLLKCLTDVVISSINLKDFGYYKNILSSNHISINAMVKAKQISGSEKPEDWIPVFLKILEEYDKNLKAKRLQDNEKKQAKWDNSRVQQNDRNKIIKT